MPTPDPIPSAANSTKRRFWRVARLLALLSLVVAVIAMILVNAGDSTLHVNMLLATGLGVFFTMLVGTSLMALVFLSSSSGHDEAAARQTRYEEDE